eukprot:1642936-Rhodomonas_salina.2
MEGGRERTFEVRLEPQRLRVPPALIPPMDQLGRGEGIGALEAAERGVRGALVAEPVALGDGRERGAEAEGVVALVALLAEQHLLLVLGVAAHLAAHVVLAAPDHLLDLPLRLGAQQPRQRARVVVVAGEERVEELDLLRLPRPRAGCLHLAPVHDARLRDVQRPWLR